MLAQRSDDPEKVNEDEPIASGTFNFFDALYGKNKSPAEKMANKIGTIYTKGIEALLTAKGPNSNDPYIILIFNCPIEFYNKYSKHEGSISKTKGLDLFSGLVSSENLNLGAGMQDEDYQFDEEKKKIEIFQKYEVTEKFKRLLKDLFENFDAVAEELIETILKLQSNLKAENLKKENEEYYNKMNELYKQVLNDEDGFYYYFNFADFILIFSRILKVYLEFDIKLEFTDCPSIFLLSIYGNDDQIKKMAQNNEYELKLKSYAFKYQTYLDELTSLQKLQSVDNKQDDKIHTANTILKQEPLINTDSSKSDALINVQECQKKWRALKYSELNRRNVLHWPPYVEYDNQKDDKYQRYEPNDDYHECNADEFDQECKNGKCSIFRNIDKLRVIYDSVDKMIKISYMVQEKILNFILLKRNHVDYKDKLSYKGILGKGWNVFNQASQMDHIFTIRNFYGETIAYYFLWLADYVRWLIIPTIVGLCVYPTTYLYESSTEKKIESTNNYLYGIFMILFCVFISMWATMFLSQWRQKERLHNYFWGTENYKHLEPDSESFIPEGTKELIFNVKFPYVRGRTKFFKYLVSYLVLVIMLFITITGVLSLFYLKKYFIGNPPESVSEANRPYYEMGVGMGIASLNAVQIKVLNLIYSTLATKLNAWENHQKDYQATNFLAIKLILFDFVNNFFPIYYIAFIKSQNGLKFFFDDSCITTGRGCLSEIETQLYTTFGINLVFNVIEIGLPWFSLYKHKKALEKVKKDKQIENSIYDQDNKFEVIPHSIEHQLICDPYNDLIAEYSEVLIQFGYVCLFSVAAPLTPLLVFVLLYLEKFVDTFKMFFLVRMNIIDGSTGLDIYNSIVQGIIYVGLLTNLGIIAFADNHFFKTSESEVENKLTRVVIYAIVEIVMFLACRISRWNIIPSWFKFVGEIKELYHKKYFNRMNDLPHLNLEKNISNIKNNKKKPKKPFSFL